VNARAGRSCEVPREIASTDRPRRGSCVAWPSGRRHQAHLAPLPPPQLHHRCPRCGRSAPRRADRRPSRRSPDHHPLRPGP
jgi:hypothetical protein